MNIFINSTKMNLINFITIHNTVIMTFPVFFSSVTFFPYTRSELSDFVLDKSFARCPITQECITKFCISLSDHTIVAYKVSDPRRTQPFLSRHNCVPRPIILSSKTAYTKLNKMLCTPSQSPHTRQDLNETENSTTSPPSKLHARSCAAILPHCPPTHNRTVDADIPHAYKCDPQYEFTGGGTPCLHGWSTLTLL